MLELRCRIRFDEAEMRPDLSPLPTLATSLNSLPEVGSFGDNFSQNPISTFQERNISTYLFVADIIRSTLTLARVIKTLLPIPMSLSSALHTSILRYVRVSRSVRFVMASS
jgi:hypothetical protein